MRKTIFILAMLLFLVSTSNGSEIKFHVTLSGSGELHPGDDKPITILIQNEGKVTDFVINENTSSILPLLTTAKSLRVELDVGNAPITIQTHQPLLLGDLPSGMVARALFRVRVSENAKLGDYTLNLKLRYNKVEYSILNQTPVISYREESDIESLKVSITKKDYDFSIVSLNSSLIAGKEGKVDVVIRNTGKRDMYDAILIINTTPPISPNPKAMTAFLGDLEVNREAKASFKVFVLEGALNQTYPVSFILKFKTSSDLPLALAKSAGLKIEDKATFTARVVESLLTSPQTISRQSTSSPSKLGIGMQIPERGAEVSTIPSRGFVRVIIKNNGEDVRDAEAVLKFSNPLIQAENSPYIGYFRHGEERDLLFYIKSSAPPGSYRATLFLRYKNMLGDEEVSKPIFIEVEEKSESPVKIKEIITRNIGVGLTGSIVLSIENTLNSGITNAEFTAVSPSPALTILSPVSFVEEIIEGGRREIKFRISVSDDAVNGTYRIYLIERYDVDGAEDLVSISSIPIVIQSKLAHFELLSVKSNLYPDETGSVEVEIRNSGSFVAHDTVVELEVTPPLKIAGGGSLGGMFGASNAGKYFVGTLKPGERAIAKFRLDVDKEAGAGSYPVTIKVRYYDSDGYLHTSNPITASVVVKEKSMITPVTLTAIFLALIAILAGIKFARNRKRKMER